MHLSADDKRVILNRSDPDIGYPGVWSVDLERGASSRVTSGTVDFSPIWSGQDATGCHEGPAAALLERVADGLPAAR